MIRWFLFYLRVREYKYQAHRRCQGQWHRSHGRTRRWPLTFDLLLQWGQLRVDAPPGWQRTERKRHLFSNFNSTTFIATQWLPNYINQSIHKKNSKYMINEIVKYHQISNIRWTKSQNLNVPCLCPIQWSQVNEDVVGAAPTGDAPTTSEWSTIMLSAKVPLILQIWR